MKSVLNYLFVFLAVGLTLLSGVIYGRASQRWGASKQGLQVASQLANLPEEFGEWKQQSESKLSENVQTILQCHGSLNRVYQNTRTKEEVSIAIVVGPSGPTAVHTPAICYSSRDYKVVKPESALSIDTGIGKQTLWFTEFQSKGLEKHSLRTYHAWSFDGEWEASQDPRIAYMWKPYLTKIQVASRLPSGDESTDDAGIRFLKDFIPQLNDKLFSDSAANPTTTP